jgi:hypothetical protein
MATPNYQGQGQPTADSGGWLGSLLGGTPAYKGVGQPSSKSSVISGSAPAYKPAPSASSADMSACGPGSIAIVIPRDVIEQQ